MQSPVLAHKMQQRALPVQIQANAILNMNLIELQQFIETEAMENPALGVEDRSRCHICGFMATQASCPVCGASMKSGNEIDVEKSNERDYLEHAFSIADSDCSFDPFGTVASTEDLNSYLKQQARMSLAGRKLRIAEYLIDSLDEDGYFRESLFETAEEFATAVPEIETVLAIVQTFDPAGIAARDLKECLLIQLRYLNSNDAIASIAEQILMDYWDDFSRMKLKFIAKRMNTALSVIQEACEFIRENLTPHPASTYRAPFDELSPNKTAVIVPDVIVHKKGESFIAEAVDCHGSTLKIDETYDEVYSSIKTGDSYLNAEDLKHIKEHVERVKGILDAISLRKKTLTRVANHLIEYQKDFLVEGPLHLKPLRQKDVAAALEVHESTICRAISNKYCKLPSGEVVSFDMFFDSALPVRNMIRQLITRSVEPISDGDIAKKLADQGITIARRTVAKYREQLKLLPCQLRAA